ncbi:MULTISPECIES: hypothetical protein [Nocardiopsidaceae]|uniref:Sporulation protein n=2 Tax=Nocardiopsidaceae TaxID=83676 RepID=A0ABY6YNU0_9ACTN|nr:hypothetical protein [Streptomonospora nanhaiensis]MEE2047270.1 hypothetical protein [Nocardiopsis tropica]WAE73837.1 hypothetical protein OUQ99_01530 [Streptomonospora nanhaiensis]
MPENVSSRIREAASGRRTSPALSVLSDLVRSTGAAARSATVFGDPVVSGGSTVVPVARITSLTSLGGGSSRLFAAGGDGAGGGGFVRARPAGFIVLDEAGARFHGIRQPVTMLVLPLAVVAGLTAARIVGVSLREARRRRSLRARCEPAAAPPAEVSVSEGSAAGEERNA